MAATITFDQVFTKEGAKNGRAWKRWDFKFGDDRYSTFDKGLADLITVGQPATIEFDTSTGNNGYTNRTITAVLTPNADPSAQPATEAPVASQTPSNGEAEGRTRAIIAAQLAPALFQEFYSLLDEDQKGPDSAKRIARSVGDDLVDWAFGR